MSKYTYMVSFGCKLNEILFIKSLYSRAN